MKKPQDLVFYDRYSQELKSEGIYGEKPLRWAYETRLGRICLSGVIRRKWFSRLYGRWADCGCSAKEIPSFLSQFELDTTEFLEPVESFQTFNEFFFRKLKPEARPVSENSRDVVFPADGRHLWIPDLSQESHLYAKGQRFDLTSLLGDESLAKKFSNGSALLSRLCPTDYHRYHFPVSGHLASRKMINGSLFSVNPIALSRRLSYISENKRQISEITDTAAGDCLFLEIGATNVGSIVNTAPVDSFFAKGDEKGYFRFGGSMVITIFLSGAVNPASDLETNSAVGIELYAKMGDKMGAIAG